MKGSLADRPMKIVIKIGGVAVEDSSLVQQCAQAVLQLMNDGHQVVIVHGGGADLTRTLAKLGKTSEFINGLRVTDAETRDVALMVLAGRINKTLVAGLAKAGVAAIGMCGGDGGSVRARKRHGADLGYVGEVAAVDPQWLDLTCAHGGVPVLSSMAPGVDGQYYNINADQMAAACAIGWNADALFFLTDVAGVKDSQGTVMRWLETGQIAALIESSVVGGGMLPKLEACREALKKGVRRVRILPASQASCLSDFYFSRIECGTEVLVA